MIAKGREGLSGSTKQSHQMAKGPHNRLGLSDWKHLLAVLVGFDAGSGYG